VSLLARDQAPVKAAVDRANQTVRRAISARARLLLLL
jgi:hypothetical protein